MNFRQLRNIFVVGIFTLLLGCNDKDMSGMGKLRVQMTDAPFPTDIVREANVTISKIEIRKSGEQEGAPFLTLSEKEHSMNLLELTNGITASLVDLEVPVGSYDQVRLYVDKASVVLTDGSVHDLKVPSGASSGIKVTVSPGIVVAGGLTTELLLDFDVSRSFVAQGDIKTPATVKGFSFSPSLKAANLSTSGRITGRVHFEEAALQGAQVSVWSNHELYTSTFTDAQGNYVLLGLPAGSYEVVVEASGYASYTVEGVTVTAANMTEKNFAMIVQ